MSHSSTSPSLPTLVVGPGESRTTAPLNVVGEELQVKVAGRDTDDRFAILYFAVPSMTGPPLHRHTHEDELFYVLEGELTFQIDGKSCIAKTGAAVFAPRHTVHTYQNFSSLAARLLIMVAPAGLEHFFEELSKGTPAGAAPDPIFFRTLDEKYGLKTLGPPLGK
jgi:quercetin dioxygenase-like cupin family protein